MSRRLYVQSSSTIKTPARLLGAKCVQSFLGILSLFEKGVLLFLKHSSSECRAGENDRGEKAYPMIYSNPNLMICEEQKYLFSELAPNCRE